MVSPETAPEPEPSTDATSFAQTWKLRGGSGAPDPETAPDRDWPTEVAHYRLGRMLGRGNFGRVFAAVDTLTGSSVAVKLVDADDQERVGALRDEAEWLAAINRPNVPKIFGHGTTEGWAWLAIELVEGRSLAEIIAGPTDDFDVLVGGEARTEATSSLRRRARTRWFRRTPDPRVREIMGWFRDLATTLHDLHERGVIHRDIKPANIVIHRGGLPYLIDFGLGIDDFDASGQNLYLAGTIPYMSPEQAGGGTGGLGPESDLYSLAVTFHEALTGRRVVERGRGAATIQDIRFRDVPPPSKVNPELPHALDPIFTHACRKNPKLRYANGAQLAEDIEAWFAGRPPIHAPESSRTRRRRWTRRSAGVLAGLALVALVIFFGLRRQRREAAFAEIRVAIAEQRSTDALEACLRHAPTYAQDPEFGTLYENAEGSSAVTRIDEFLTLLGVSRGTPDPDSQVARRARDAQRHLQYLSKPSFRFIAAMGAYLEGRREEAMALLHPPGQASLLEDELRAVCYLADPEDADRYQAQLAVIRDHSGVPLRGANELCVQAWRELTHANSAVYEPKWREILGDPSPHYAKARAILTLVQENKPAHGAAKVMMANLELNAGSYALARQIYVELANALDADTTPADRLGPYYYAALATILEAAEVEGDRRRSLKEQALQYLTPLQRRDPEWLWSLLAALRLRGWLPAWIGARLLFDETELPAAGVPDQVVETLGALAREAAKALEGLELRDAQQWLAERLESLWLPERGPGGKKCIRGAQTYFLWAVGGEVLEALQAHDASLAATARRMRDTAARLEPEIGLEPEGRYWVLVACHFLAIHGEPEEREKACEDLIAHLPELIDEFRHARASETRAPYIEVVDERLRVLRRMEREFMDR